MPKPCGAARTSSLGSFGQSPDDRRSCRGSPERRSACSHPRGTLANRSGSIAVTPAVSTGIGLIRSARRNDTRSPAIPLLVPQATTAPPSYGKAGDKKTDTIRRAISTIQTMALARIAEADAKRACTSACPCVSRTGSVHRRCSQGSSGCRRSRSCRNASGRCRS